MYTYLLSLAVIAINNAYYNDCSIVIWCDRSVELYLKKLCNKKTRIALTSNFLFALG